MPQEALDLGLATPMMQQYYDVKKQYPGCIVFFRLGDFYEMFGEDAQMEFFYLENAFIRGSSQ